MTSSENHSAAFPAPPSPEPCTSNDWLQLGVMLLLLVVGRWGTSTQAQLSAPQLPVQHFLGQPGPLAPHQLPVQQAGFFLRQTSRTAPASQTNYRPAPWAGTVTSY